MKQITLRHCVTFLTICILVLNFSCKHNSYISTQGVVWNTSYNITYDGSPAFRDSILHVLDEIGASLNVFDERSLVSKANRQASTIVDRHFKTVYNISRQINNASNGMFDPTLSPLINAWGFGPGHKQTQDTLSIDSILCFVGINKTRLDGELLKKDDKRIEFNFSAVAKGYGCDAVAEMFRRNNIENFLIEIGGELALGGKSPSGEDWKISIDAPTMQKDKVTHDSYIIIATSERGIATSGNYRNFITTGNKTIGHTISPLTGHPVETDVVSATVVAPTCAEADAAATACMAAGSIAAKRMLENLHYDGLLILSDSTSWMTPGFKSLVIKN